MTAEVELKLALPERSLRELEDAPLLRQAAAQARTERLSSVYFDTRKLKLYRCGLSLRVRSDGKRHVQTVKSMHQASSGLASRGEWEAEIPGPAPDLAMAGDTALEPLLSKRLARALKPIFETRVERKLYPLRVGGASVELALDRGCIETDHRSEQICELEIELKQGHPAELFRVARELAEAAPLRLSVRSKAERGYGLVAGEKARAVSAGDIELCQGSSSAEAFAKIASSGLFQVVANWEAVCRGDAQGVHEMRVGLRRLRTALSLFSAMLRDGQSQTIKQGLKWLADELGPARQLHVFKSRVIEPFRSLHARIYSFDSLDEELARRRDEGEARARAAIESARFRALLLEASEWIEEGDWLKTPDELISAMRRRPIEGVAADILSRRTAKILKRGKKLRELDARKCHKLRIATKKLRYGTEFFATLFGRAKPSEGRKDFLKALKRLQSFLGDLNDVTAHQQYCISLARERPSGGCEVAYLAGIISGLEEAKVEPRLRSSERAHRQLMRMEPFWK